MKITPTKSHQKLKRSHNREQLLLDTAAKLFATKGYKNTTMRDISSGIDMHPGSLYYHFKSKQEILLAIYKQAVYDLKNSVEIAISHHDNPWEKLQIATETHLETILDQSHYAQVMIEVLPNKVPEIQHELTILRNDYEKVFIDIISSLPLKKDVDKTLLRLMLIGAMNSTRTWFQRSNSKPRDIGKEFIRYLRESIG